MAAGSASQMNDGEEEEVHLQNKKKLLLGQRLQRRFGTSESSTTSNNNNTEEDDENPFSTTSEEDSLRVVSSAEFSESSDNNNLGFLLPSSPSPALKNEEERAAAGCEYCHHVCCGGHGSDETFVSHHSGNYLPSNNGEFVDEDLPSLSHHGRYPLNRSQSMVQGLGTKTDETQGSVQLAPPPEEVGSLQSPKQLRSTKSSINLTAHTIEQAQLSARHESNRPDIFVGGAENRSYLVGPGGSTLIGKEELEAVLPDGKANIFVGTWNIAGQSPSEEQDLRQWLGPECSVDIYAIGLQEGPALDTDFWKEWEIMIQECLGHKYLSYYSLRLGVQLLVVYVRKSLIWFLTVPSSSALSTNPANVVKYYVKTKGAVAVAFQLFRTTFLFVSCHLSYGAKSDIRVKDYKKIVEGIRFRKFPMRPGANLSIENFDRVFWFGDLNFKVEAHRSVVEALIYRAIPTKGAKNKRADFSALLQKDQLTKEMAAGRIFHGFHEGEIGFPPTYKYDIGSNNLDSTKNRVPSYTDRVLYRDNERELYGKEGGVELLAYDSAHNLTLSDHKPVFAVYRVAIQPGGSKHLSSAGSKLLLIKRAQSAKPAKKDKHQRALRTKKSAICSTM